MGGGVYDAAAGIGEAELVGDETDRVDVYFEGEVVVFFRAGGHDAVEQEDCVEGLGGGEEGGDEGRGGDVALEEGRVGGVGDVGGEDGGVEVGEDEAVFWGVEEAGGQERADEAGGAGDDDVLCFRHVSNRA